MSIASQITTMQEHIEDIYDTFAVAGVDTSAAAKNIVNINANLKERLEYYLANGLDVVWNNWNKVSGSGTTLSLNNTIQAKMDFVYKGNTYQYSTIGKNLFNVNATHENNLSDAGITATFNSDGTITVNGTKNANYKAISYNITLPAGTYYFSGCPSGGSGGGYSIIVQTTNEISSQIFDTGNGATFTLTEQKKISFFPVRVGADAVTFNNAVFKPMIARVPVTYNDYEPYTNGASPNPDYPQDIQVVSGDNTIKVEGKNWFDEVFRQGNQHNNWNTSRIFSNKNDWKVNVGDKFTFSTNLDLTTFDYSFYIMQYPYLNVSSNTMLYTSNYQATNTFTINCEYEGYLGFTIRKKNESNLTPRDISNYWFQIEKGSSATTYQPYQSASYPINLGDIELCKIEDYQDYIRKSTGKNLFDKNSATYKNGYLKNDNGIEQTTSQSGYTTSFTPVKPSTKYTINGTLTSGTNTTSFRLYYYDINKNWISRTEAISGNNIPYTFTTPNNCYFIQFQYIEMYYDASTIMINEGETALPYEPYGKIWYLNKQIGKVVLDGSSASDFSGADGSFTYIVDIGMINANIDTLGYLKCNYYQEIQNYKMYDSSVNYGITRYGPTGTYNFAKLVFKNIDINNTHVFANWLSTHNTDVYYVLSTPTTTEITDTTLISQLEAIKKSYNSQTNISQTNTDKPFILDVTALKDLDAEDTTPALTTNRGLLFTQPPVSENFINDEDDNSILEETINEEEPNIEDDNREEEEPVDFFEKEIINNDEEQEEIPTEPIEIDNGQR